MNVIARLASTLLHLHLPIMRKTVFFQSFHGQYNDNPKYVSEELHRRNPNVKIAWAIKDGRPETFPDYVALVPIDSPAYTKYISRAQVVVDNYVGCRSSFLKSNNVFRRAICKLRAKHRKGQFCLSTWHGNPLKCIALDEPQYKQADFSKAYLCTDVLLANDQPTADAFRTAFLWRKPLSLLGMPRNDLLFCDQQSREKIKSKLGLSLDKHYVLYAPTFRKSIEMSGLYQLEQLDIGRLLDTLSKTFGGEWEFIFRSHNEVMKSISQNRNINNKKIINGNQYEDMAEYLVCADVLITDYSGSMFDFSITHRPCFLYTPDLKSYAGKERGFYEDIYAFPFPLAIEADTLIKNINEFDTESYKIAVDELLKKRGCVENGKSAKLVVDEIEKHIQ